MLLNPSSRALHQAQAYRPQSSPHRRPSLIRHPALTGFAGVHGLTDLFEAPTQRRLSDFQAQKPAFLSSKKAQERRTQSRPAPRVRLERSSSPQWSNPTLPALWPPKALIGVLHPHGSPLHSPDLGQSFSTTQRFVTPEGDLTLLVTEPEARVSSSNKRRRWGLVLSEDMENLGSAPIWCCLEFKRDSSLSRLDYLSQAHAELMRLAQLNPHIEVKALFETEDGYALALMTNLPEESHYLLENLAQDEVGDANSVHRAAASDSAYVSATLALFDGISRHLHDSFHSRNFIHGDVKLPNSMLTAQGQVSLIDFGESQPIDTWGMGTVRATSFWPPEGHHGRFGPSGDIFALGVSLFTAFAALDRAHAGRKDEDDEEGLQTHAAQWRQDMVMESNHVIENQMQFSNSPFHQWRRQMVHDPLAALRDPQARDFVAATASFRELAPQLFSHWLTSLVSDRPADRASLGPTLQLLSELRANQSHDAEALAKSRVATLLEASMSHQIEPMLRQAAALAWSQPA